MTQVSSLYLHIPFCKHLCNYCDFYKRKFEQPQKQIEEFHQFLLSSVERHERLMAEHRAQWAPGLKTIYLGGGTPSLWGKAGADFYQQHFPPPETGAEFTMEIDPGTWNAEMIESWKALGLNRISIGTQTLNPEFLGIMDRSHSLEESHLLLQYCSENDWNFSLDFLLGLPYSREKKRNIIQELEQLLAYHPKHISLYILNARSKYPHIQNMPEDEFIRDEYLQVSYYLRERGFHHYEVSNFALPGFESIHNLNYWNGVSVAAMGPTGTGYFAEGEKAFRYKWKVQSAEIEGETLTPEQLEMERTYLQLRLSTGWKPHKVDHHLLQLFSKWKELGYGSWNGEKMQLEPAGFLMLDSLMDDLFRLEHKAVQP